MGNIIQKKMEVLMSNYGFEYQRVLLGDKR
jgi:hypothetical protein